MRTKAEKRKQNKQTKKKRVSKDCGTTTKDVIYLYGNTTRRRKRKEMGSITVRKRKESRIMAVF